MIRYTALGAEHVPLLAAMAQESFEETFGHLYAPRDLAAFVATSLSPAAYEAERVDRQIRYRLAWEDEKLVGFVKVRALNLPIPDPLPGAREIGQLYVLSGWHGTGIAQALMAWAIDSARASQAPELCLSVYIDNHRAKRFYARYGFEDCGRYAFMVGDHEDEDRLMRMRL